jgi:hypothetical protein
MPKFLYTVIVFTLLLWYLFVTYLDSIPPSNIFAKIGALLLLFFPAALTNSLILYGRKPRELKEKSPKQAYRDGIKKSLLVSLFFVILIGIKIIVIK